MPIFLSLLGRFWFVPVILIMGLAVHHYRTELRVTTAEFEAYKSKVAELGAQAEKRKIEVESANANQIRDAVSSRNAALASLRAAQAQAAAGRSRVPLTPAAAAGSGALCFDQKALSAAVERYRERVRGLVEIGDEAQIDAQALVRAWPKPK